MVKAYSFLCIVIFIATVGVSGVLLYAVFSGHTIGGGSDCTEDEQGNQICVTNLKKWEKIATTVAVVLNILIQGCA